MTYCCCSRTCLHLNIGGGRGYSRGGKKLLAVADICILCEIRETHACGPKNRNHFNTICLFAAFCANHLGTGGYLTDDRRLRFTGLRSTKRSVVRRCDELVSALMPFLLFNMCLSLSQSSTADCSATHFHSAAILSINLAMSLSRLASLKSCLVSHFLKTPVHREAQN